MGLMHGNKTLPENKNKTITVISKRKQWKHGNEEPEVNRTHDEWGTSPTHHSLTEKFFKHKYYIMNYKL